MKQIKKVIVVDQCPPPPDEPVEKVDAMLHAAELAPSKPDDEGDQRRPLAAPTVSEEPAAPPIKPPTKSPYHVAIKRAQFKFVKAAAVGSSIVYGYQHRDGRAVLITVTAEGREVWTIRWPDGAESGGRTVDTFIPCLRITTAKHAAVKERAEARTMREVAKTDDAKLVMAATKPGQLLPDGPPDHVIRAIEMLGSCTGGRYDLAMLRGDKAYSDRMAIMRSLLGRERGQVKADEVGITKLQASFYSAVGVGDGSQARQASEFASKCADLLAAWKKMMSLKKKAEARLIAAAKRATVLTRTVPGRILPGPPRKSAERRAQERENDLARLAYEAATAPPEARPDPEAQLVEAINPNNLRLIAYRNGAIGIQLERFNSQGALHLLSTGKRLSVSVLTPVLAKDVRVRNVDVDEILTTLVDMELMEVNHAPRVEEAMKAVRRAIKVAKNPGRLAPTLIKVTEPRRTADEVTVRAGNVKLLEDHDLGTVLLQLEAVNSQGAICVYNNGTKVSAGVVPPTVLQSLRPLRGADVIKAANQLLNPITPGVPVSPVAQSYLTAVLHCKELITMATTPVAASKKFAATTPAAKKTTAKADVDVKPAKKSTAEAKPAKKSTTASSDRAGYTGKKIKVLNKDHGARKGTKRQEAIDILIASKTTDDAIPKLTKIGANNSFIAFAVREKFIELV